MRALSTLAASWAAGHRDEGQLCAAAVRLEASMATSMRAEKVHMPNEPHNEGVFILGPAEFPLLADVALPVLRETLSRGASEDAVMLDTLLALMADNDDPAVWHRHGTLALRLIQQDAKTVLAAGGSGSTEGLRHFSELEETVNRYGITPNGSAALLAATLFLESLHADRRRRCEADQQG